MEKDRFDKYSKEELIQLLLKYEGFKDSILAKQNIVLKEMEKLKGMGKEKSVRYRELLGNKMVNNLIIQYLERSGINMEEDK